MFVWHDDAYWKRPCQAQFPRFAHGLGSEVICILEGSGKISIEGSRELFAANCTLILPPRQVHQITNTGGENMSLIAWLSESPARVFLPSGEQMALPWDAAWRLPAPGSGHHGESEAPRITPSEIHRRRHRLYECKGKLAKR